jgi:predicted porin
MKPCIPALALAAALAPVLVHADTTTAAVQLYGRLEVAMDSSRYSGTATRPSTSAVALSTETSYWGITGQEALGKGTRAYFKLESGFSVDTGAQVSPTSLFNREAFVGLGSATCGSIQLGSQFGPAFWITARTDPFQRSTNGAIFNLMQQNGGNKQRGYRLVQDNAIQYISPSFSGVTLRAIAGLSERTAAPDNLGAFRGVNLEYNASPTFYVGVSAEDEKVAGLTPASSISRKTYTVGATYDFRVVKLHGYLLRNTQDNAPGANAYMAGLSYPVGGGVIRTSYSSYKVSDTPGARANVVALGYTYALSKRTTLYTAYGRMNNDSASNFALWPSSKTYGLPGLGEDVRSLELGIRHFF